MYLNLDLKNVKKEEVRKALEIIGVSFKEFSNPLEMFLMEESDFRLQAVLDECKSENDLLSKRKTKVLTNDKTRKDLAEFITEEYMNKDIFDYDYMDDIRDDSIKRCMDDMYTVEFNISKEKLEEVNIKLSIDDISELENNYINGVKIEEDSREYLGSAEFFGGEYVIELILCSGQTNYWLETMFVKGTKVEECSEPFFDLLEGDVLESQSEEGVTFKAVITSR